MFISDSYRVVTSLVQILYEVWYICDGLQYFFADLRENC